jgi:hypothetical protein
MVKNLVLSLKYPNPYVIILNEICPAMLNLTSLCSLFFMSYWDLYSSKFIKTNSIRKITYMPITFVKEPTPNYIVLGLNFNLNHHSSIYNRSSFILVRPILDLWFILELYNSNLRLGFFERVNSYLQRL